MTRATFLFRSPSWLDGVAQLLNLRGAGYHAYRASPTPGAADQRAAVQDWAAVLDDCLAAAETVRKTYHRRETT